MLPQGLKTQQKDMKKKDTCLCESHKGECASIEAPSRAATAEEGLPFPGETAGRAAEDLHGERAQQVLGQPGKQESSFGEEWDMTGTLRATQGRGAMGGSRSPRTGVCLEKPQEEGGTEGQEGERGKGGMAR